MGDGVSLTASHHCITLRLNAIHRCDGVVNVERASYTKLYFLFGQHNVRGEVVEHTHEAEAETQDALVDRAAHLILRSIEKRW